MTLKQIAFKSKASQDDWEMWQMLKHVQEIKPKVIVEIGVDKGGFLDTLKQAFPAARIIGIDINKSDELKKYNMIFADSNDPRTVGLLDDVLTAPIDFLWIDGDHRYAPCKTDFELYSPLVRAGGIIGFHDTNNRGIEGVEVDQFLAELDASHSYKNADYRLHRMSPGVRLIWKE